MSKNSTVLVVDDNPDILKMISGVLRPLSINIMTAESGTSAYKIAQQETVDLIITDTRMPNGDVVWLLNSLKKDPQCVGTKIIVLFSGYPEKPEVDQDYLFNLGADFITSKPVDSKVLLTQVQKLLSQHSVP